MRQIALAAALLCLGAGLPAAEERPPEPSAVGATSGLQAGGAARPPERPKDAPEQAVPAPAADAPAPSFGPPPPPRWWLLRESDQDFAACRLALSLLGAVYSQPPQVVETQRQDCGIARPLQVTEILPGMALEGGAAMRCDTARALGFWARDFVRPAAATLPGAPRVTALVLGSGYDCRARVGTEDAAAKLSEHALGNAIDIAGFRLDDGTMLPVIPRADSGDRAEAFQRATRGAACLFFPTVLGPGSNAAHGDHLHLDMAERRGGWRLCQ